jgi:hypothetical protein
MATAPTSTSTGTSREKRNSTLKEAWRSSKTNRDQTQKDGQVLAGIEVLASKERKRGVQVGLG